MSSKPLKPLEYGIAMEVESDKEFNDLINDLNRHTQAATEIDAALAEFHSTVIGILKKHGVKGTTRTVQNTSMRSLVS